MINAYVRLRKNEILFVSLKYHTFYTTEGIYNNESWNLKNISESVDSALMTLLEETTTKLQLSPKIVKY